VDDPLEIKASFLAFGHRFSWISLRIASILEGIVSV
jgi:hypothetical protein